MLADSIIRTLCILMNVTIVGKYECCDMVESQWRPSQILLQRLRMESESDNREFKERNIGIPGHRLFFDSIVIYILFDENRGRDTNTDHGTSLRGQVMMLPGYFCEL